MASQQKYTGPCFAPDGCEIHGTKTPSLESLKDMIRKAGGTPLDGASYENENMVYASSVETFGPRTYGHPRFEVAYFKDTGWLDDRGLRR